MKRDLQKAVAEYKTKYYRRMDNKGAFYAGDVNQILNMSKSDTTSETLYNAIENALYAGYMIGYRTAKRERANKSS